MKGDSNLGVDTGAGCAGACGAEALTLVTGGVFSGAIASGNSSNADAEGAGACFVHRGRPQPRLFQRFFNSTHADNLLLN
jgi:hypothetical protein